MWSLFRPSNCLVGYDLLVSNKELDVDLEGPPLHILESFAWDPEKFKDVAEHDQTAITSGELRASAEFTGSALEDMRTEMCSLLDLLRKKRWKDAKELLRKDPALLTEEDGEKPLVMCSFLGLDEGVSLLLAENAEATGSDMMGMTALHWASAMGRDKVVEILLQSGSDPAKINAWIMTPLNLAHANRHKTVAKQISARAPELQGRRTAENVIKLMMTEEFRP